MLKYQLYMQTRKERTYGKVFDSENEVKAQKDILTKLNRLNNISLKDIRYDYIPVYLND